MSSKKEEQELLDMLSRKINQASDAIEEPKPIAGEPATASRTKPSSFSLTEEDENCIADFTMWLMSQGVRTTNRTLIVRTALRLAEKDKAFLKTYNELRLQDKRRKK